MKTPPLIIALLIASLQGCATAVKQTNPTDHSQFNARQIVALEQWQLSGKLGLRSPQQANTANLHWQQQREAYQLRLSGPLGSGATQISGNSGRIEIRQGAETYTGTPELLGLQLIGVPLPVDAMSWWIRGLPSPNHKATTNMVTSAEGTPISFEQAGWQLSYSQFQRIDQYLLPKKVSGQFGDLSFKLVISNWSFPDSQ